MGTYYAGVDAAESSSAPGPTTGQGELLPSAEARLLRGLLAVPSPLASVFPGLLGLFPPSFPPGLFGLFPPGLSGLFPPGLFGLFPPGLFGLFPPGLLVLLVSPTSSFFPAAAAGRKASLLAAPGEPPPDCAAA